MSEWPLTATGHPVPPGPAGRPDPAFLLHPPPASAAWAGNGQAQNGPDEASTAGDPAPDSAGELSALPSPEPVLVHLADVVPQRVSWLWLGRLPAGKLVTLDGDPGLGKSTLALDMAAHVSSGARWPDDTPCPLGDVVVLSAEDGLADTIRPRLDAADADPSRVHALTAVRVLDEDGQSYTRPPTLADLAVIREVIERHGARLLIVDVLMAYLPGRVDSHRDQDVRAVLHRLAELGETTGARCCCCGT